MALESTQADSSRFYMYKDIVHKDTAKVLLEYRHQQEVLRKVKYGTKEQTKSPETSPKDMEIYKLLTKK